MMKNKRTVSKNKDAICNAGERIDCYFIFTGNKITTEQSSQR